VSWTDLLGLHKNICKKAEVVPIALEIAKPAYGITLHSTEPEEYTANKKTFRWRQNRFRGLRVVLT
jgi:hypothetical protein